jgi:hypothetical protein
MELISIIPKYYEFVRLLRMHPSTVHAFIEDAQITPEQQIEYMEKYSKNYFICLLYGEPVGYIGVIDDDIRICTHPNYERIGVGKFMLKEIINIFPNATGRIKKDNVSSQKLFQKCDVPYELL